MLQLEILVAWFCVFSSLFSCGSIFSDSNFSSWNSEKLLLLPTVMQKSKTFNCGINWNDKGRGDQKIQRTKSLTSSDFWTRVVRRSLNGLFTLQNSNFTIRPPDCSNTCLRYSVLIDRYFLIEKGQSCRFNPFFSNGWEDKEFYMIFRSLHFYTQQRGGS